MHWHMIVIHGFTFILTKLLCSRGNFLEYTVILFKCSAFGDPQGPRVSHNPEAFTAFFHLEPDRRLPIELYCLCRSSITQRPNSLAPVCWSKLIPTLSISLSLSLSHTRTHVHTHAHTQHL